MELKKELWTELDKDIFQEYLLSLGRGKEKSKWEQNITRTKLPCIAVLSKDVSQVVKEISKGNFQSFLDLWLWENLTNTIINASLISKIKDFNLMVSYLDKFVQKADNWASIDTLAFQVSGKEDKFFNLAEKYLSSDRTFVRRAGVRILFKFINEKYIDRVFDLLSRLKNEQEYYVNMAISWLVCEAFIKQRNKTIEFLKEKRLNTFTQNKAISKCRDSFRIGKEDKALLLNFKI